MLNIKKVVFVHTVHWVGLGPVSELTDEQFSDALWVENMSGFAFEHASGEITWVPASNIRWVSGSIVQASEHVGPSESIEEKDSDKTPPYNFTSKQQVELNDLYENHPNSPKKRGRPRKVH